MLSVFVILVMHQKSRAVFKIYKLGVCCVARVCTEKVSELYA